MNETWIFFRGRWRVIGSPGLLGIVASSVLAAWLLGAAMGSGFVFALYEKRIAATESDVQKMKVVVRARLGELNSKMDAILDLKTK